MATGIVVMLGGGLIMAPAGSAFDPNDGTADLESAA